MFLQLSFKFSKSMYFALLVIWLSIAMANGQDQLNLVIEKPELDDILNEDGINIITEDKLGFLWIGSWNGLFRYDGNQSINFTLKYEGLLGKKISYLFSSADSMVWIGTYSQGLYTFNINNNQIQKFYYSGDYKIRNVIYINQDKHGTIWVGTNDKLLSFKDNKLKEYELVETINGKPEKLMITAIGCDNYYKLWLGTNYGLYRFDPKTGAFTRAMPEINSYVSDILKFEDKIWICSKVGLFQLIPENETYRDAKPFHVSPNGTTIYTPSIRPVNNKPGLFWVTTQNTFYLINDRDNTSKPVRLFTGQSENANTIVQTCYETKSGVLWLGSLHGLFKANTNPKKFISYLNYEQRRMIYGLSAGPGNNLWIGTWGDGLHHMELNSLENQFKTREVQLGYTPLKEYTKYVYAVHSQKDATSVWFGTKGAGVVKLNINNGKYNGKVDWYNTASGKGVDDDYILGINEDLQGNIWAGSWDGKLYLYNKKSDRFSEVDFKYGSITNNKSAILKIYQPEKGILLLGTFGNGVIKLTLAENNIDVLRSETFFYREGERYFRANFINDIMMLNSNHVLIASDQGLYLVGKNNSIKEYSIADGLLSATFVILHKDLNHDVWVASDAGLSKMAFKDSGLISIQNYTSSDGLQKNLFQPRALAYTAEGKVFMGTSNGFICFFPKEITDTHFMEKVTLTELKLFNDIIEPGTKFNGKEILSRNIGQTQSISLAYEENTLTIGFSSMNFISPHRVKYAYKIEGLNADWSYTDARYPYAQYTRLPPGSWKFMVKCTNSDGNWSKEVTSLDIIINPPWWKSIYAYIFYAVLFVAMVVLIKYISDFKHKLELKQLEYKKDLEVFDLQLKFYTNISHEFRTPLALITGTIDLLKKKGLVDANNSEGFSKIDRYAKILKRLVDDIMDMRKVEKDTLNLNFQRYELTPFLKSLCGNFAQLFAQKDITFEFKSYVSDKVYIIADELRFESIIYNLLSNAFKFTPPQGKVSCTLTLFEKSVSGKSWYSKKKMRKFVKIAIADTGIGIPTDEQKLVFEQFYTASNNQNYSKLAGTGIGLPFVRKLIQLHNGIIEVKSEQGKGSEFIVYIPVEGNTGLDQVEYSPETETIAIPHSKKRQDNPVDGKEIKEGELILIVDDNADMREIIINCLPEKYRIIEAMDGEEAWQMALEHLPDLVITDILMPKMSGTELCEKIKTTDITNHIPVIMITALPTVQDRIAGLKMGADSYIPKPFETEHLLIRIEKLIESRRKLKYKLMRSFWAKPEIQDTDEKPDPNLEFINKVKSCVEKNISNPEYAIPDLCKELGLSNMQLFRKFKSAMDISANKFIRLMRLQKAKQLFERGGLNVAEVTYAVGFNDLRYFRTCFREVFGLTPSEFIKKVNNIETLDENDEDL
jgi:signal transduction histidine kinase/DNA-binding response OmpR family regulator/ligand-binding sensor domain-containing protein